MCPCNVRRKTHTFSSSRKKIKNNFIILFRNFCYKKYKLSYLLPFANNVSFELVNIYKRNCTQFFFFTILINYEILQCDTYDYL